MRVLATAEEVPARPIAQALAKPARFDMTVCKAELPVLAHTHSGIVVIRDTGCRTKQATDAFPSCIDRAAWPFARIASQAAKFQAGPGDPRR